MFDILRKKFSSIVKKTIKEAKKTVKTAVKPQKKEKVNKEKSIKEKKTGKGGKSKVQQQAMKSEQVLKQGPKIEIIPESAEELVEETAPQVQQEESSFGFFTKIKGYLTKSSLTKKQFDEAFEDLELTLLENNVALEAVDAIKEKLSTDLVEKEIKKNRIDDFILQSLKEAILSVVQEPPNIFKAIEEKKEPYVMLFFGINGTGKTTTIAKLAHLFKKVGISCVLAAADTFRAAAIEQLKTHAQKIGVPIIAADYGADPASVAFEAIQYAKKHHVKVVLVDTAGRMYTKENLLREMEKVVRVAKPDLKLFVGESITGNDATEQTRTFNDSIGIDGIILTKADIDEKAGTILSVSQVTGKPIYFLGTGQTYDNLEMFTKKTVLKNLGLD